MQKTNTLIISSLNISEYFDILNRFTVDLDIYYQIEFLEIDAKIQKGQYEIFIAYTDTEVFIYPYIKLAFLNPNFQNYFDITSPYGYCGPYCNNSIFFNEGEALFMEYISSNCVTEFVRYHFDYNEKLKFSQNISNIHNRTIVLLNIDQPWENIWTKEFSSTNRNLIRKVEKEGFTFEETKDTKDLDNFIEMYYLTMNNAGAGTFYYFEKEIIHELYDSLGDKIILVKVAKEGIVYSYSLFFLSGGIGTYYLSSRNLDFAKVPATNYLLSKTVELLQARNIKKINFGGGLTNDLNDHLFKFKSNFSKTNKDFVIGKRIFNDEIYQKIIIEWISVHGLEDYESRKQILQFYR